ncbi:site-specific integrase [Pontibacter harenae]|uniref:site-specific integrase n=1 Tax=Pontibacter harenae TaxID=2894083 RepID=UPI001E5CB007|nr:site-specific integrase [Pontibacter harenae]MCC9166874.1 site-specific integrase [Pontibacter harenae]
MENPVATKIILDTRRALKDGTYPVKLRLTHLRKQKYYLVGVSLTEEAFTRTQGDNPRGNYKTLQLKFNGVEQKARGVIDKLDVFTFPSFERQFLNSVSKVDVFSAFEDYINSIKEEGRITTAISYTDALRSVKAFHGRANLPFAEVTPEFLKRYEKWMLSRKRSTSTIGMYLRPLKAVFNSAIADGLVNEKLYPFGKRNFVIPTSRNVNRGLTLDEVKKIVEYEPVHDSEARARDLWLFSYLSNGANMIDIANLRYSNISTDYITFIRSKSKNTKRQNLKPIVAVLTEYSKAIIKRWGNKPVEPNMYVFPILEDGLSAEQEVSKVKQAVKNINTYMKRIAGHVGLEHNITTYWARHSYSNVLMNKNISTEFISKALGHSNKIVTENYLGNFATEEQKRVAALLTSF